MGIMVYVPGVDFRANNLGQVTPTGEVYPDALVIEGDENVVNEAQFNAKIYPIFATEREITWSITSGAEYASISQTGLVSAISGAINSPVTIRATSDAVPGLYAEKAITVTFGNITFYDYLQGDGSGYLLIPPIPNVWSKTLTVIGTIPNGNGYLFGVRLASSSTTARAGFYNSSANKLSILFGNRGFVNSTITPGSTKYRMVLKSSSSSSDADATCVVYNAETGVAVYTMRSASTNKLALSGVIGILTFGTGGTVEDYVVSSGTQCTGKIYSLKVEDDEQNVILELVPAQMNGTPGMLDTVSGIFYTSATGQGLTVGND